MIPSTLWAYKVGVYILPMNKLFCNFETAPVNKVSFNMFKWKPHAPLALDETLKLLKVCLLDKQSLLMKSFPFLMTYLKTCFWPVIYTPVILHSQWYYWLSSLRKRYPWYKFPSHTISCSWHTRRGVYTPSYSLPPTSHISCMLTIVAKRCTFK